jgi:hypothetical protein
MPTATKATTTPATRETPDLTVTVPICFHLGWTMGVLYRELVMNPPGTASTRTPVPGATSHLPSEHEFPTGLRVTLEFTRLHALIQRLNGPGAPYAHVFDPGTPPSAAATVRDVMTFNTSVLTAFTKCGADESMAYQLGRSLRDTVNPPLRPYKDLPAATPGETYEDRQRMGRLCWAFNRDRVATLQDWLSTLSPHFPQNAAKVVGSSVGRWADFSGVAFDDDMPGALKGSNTRASIAQAMFSRLFRQGDAWLALLVGDESTSALLSPEGYVAAGDAAMRRTARIIGKVIARYWWVLLVLAVALGVALFLASRYLGGAGKVWTYIATIGASLGVSWKGVSAAIPKLAEDAERPIFGLEEVEAMAWSVTTLPPNLAVTSDGVRYLRRSGAAPPSPLGALW